MPLSSVLFLLVIYLSSTFSTLTTVQLQQQQHHHHHDKNNCTNHFHHFDRAVSESVNTARHLLNSYPNSESIPTSDRLAVMILFSHGLSEKGNKRFRRPRIDHFECALRKIKENLMPKTFVDVYIWVMNATDTIPVIPSWLTREEFPHFHIMSIHPESWKVPCHLKPHRQWTMS